MFSGVQYSQCTVYSVQVYRDLSRGSLLSNVQWCTVQSVYSVQVYRCTGVPLCRGVEQEVAHGPRAGPQGQAQVSVQGVPQHPLVEVASKLGDQILV